MGYIAIVDYGVGNLKSVANAMQYLGFQISIAAESESLERADAIILPGVGAFPDAANKLRESGVENALTVQAEKKPVLGPAFFTALSRFRTIHPGRSHRRRPWKGGGLRCPGATRLRR